MEDRFTVQAPESEVRSVLEGVLTADEMEQLELLEQSKHYDSFEPRDRGEAITFITVVVWVGKTVVGSVMGRAAYDLLKKAYSALEARYGASRIDDKAPEE
jgi:hypothetical protein